jgi:hypothetical protein
VGVDDEVYKRNVDRQDKLLACILDAAACIQKGEDQLRQTTLNSNELQSALKLAVGISNGNKFFISVLQICQLKIKLK